MKGFTVFFIVFISVYTVLNIYICARLLSLMPRAAVLRKICLFAVVFLSVSFFLGRSLRGILPSVSDVFILIGSYYLAVMFFTALLLLVIDVIRAANHFFIFFPDFFITKAMLVKRVTAGIVFLLVCAIMAFGYFNANNVVVNELALSIDKKAGKLNNLKAVLVSDIHLGTVIQEDSFKRIVDLANAQDADIIFLCGDIFDAGIREINPETKLPEFKSRYGTFAVMGNHDYFGNAEANAKYISENGMTLLRDEAVLVADSFYIAGRNDFSSFRRSGKERLPLAEILSRLDHSRSVILMDHQPRELESAAETGIALQLSGHTHAGQIWPMTFLIKSMWELPCGYMKKGAASFFVTSGAGTWGPRLRIGTTPEIVVMNIKFE